MKILENAERGCQRGPDTWFSGEVWVDTVNQPEAPSRMAAALVTFTPGARTAWHTHPVGQTLYVVSGVGWAQSKGEAAHKIRPGDVVVFRPNEVHWHGAEAGHTLVHLALQESDAEGVNAVWGEKVTDAEYAAAG